MTIEVKDKLWENWVGDLTCSADYFEPCTLRELTAAVKACKDRPIRAVGASYAWSTLVPVVEGGALISTARLNRVVGIDLDNARITVEAGMRIDELIRITAANGLTLVSPPIFPELSVGGAIAVAAHGTGQAWGSFSDSVKAIRFVSPGGRDVTIRDDRDERDDPKSVPPAWEAAVASLGTHGVAYSVTLQCERAFNVQLERGYMRLDQIAEHLPEILRTYEFVELFYFLQDDRIWVELGNRTTAPPDRVKARPVWTVIRDGLADIVAAEVVPWFAKWTPFFALTMFQIAIDIGGPSPQSRPSGFLQVGGGIGASSGRSKRTTARIEAWSAFARLVGWVVGLFRSRRATEIRTADDVFHAIRTYPPNQNLEVSVPTERAPHYFRRIIEHVREELIAGRVVAHYGVHARFTGASDVWMASGYGRPSCYIDVQGLDDFSPTKSSLQALCADLTNDPGNESGDEVRFHWGKLFAETEATLAPFHAAARERLGWFRDSSRALDPGSQMWNPLVRDIIPDDPAPPVDDPGPRSTDAAPANVAPPPRSSATG